MAAVDAVVFVFTENIDAVQLDLVRAFTRANPGAISAACAIGVLGRADQISDPEPMHKAQMLARDQLRECDGALSVVIPVIGKLAETAEADALSDDDVRSLADLAALPGDSLRRLLHNRDTFVKRDAPVSPVRRGGLYDRLDRYGLRVVIDHIAASGTRCPDATAVNALLREHSGFETLRRTLVDTFGRRAEAIKTRHALARLDRALSRSAEADDSARRADVRRRLRELQREPAIRRLELLEFLAAFDAGRLRLDGDLRDDLARMSTASSLYPRLGVPEGDRVAAERATESLRRRWGELQLLGTLRQRAVADAMIEALVTIAEEIETA